MKGIEKHAALTGTDTGGTGGVRGNPMRWRPLRLAVAVCLLAVGGLIPAAAGDDIRGTLEWPREWILFGPLDRSATVPSAAELSRIPQRMEIDGEAYLPQRVRPNRQQILYLNDIYPDAGRLTTAYVFLPLEAPEDGVVTLGMGGNWWMQAWVNGELVLDTTETANLYTPIAITNHQVDVNLKQGSNVLAVRFICGSGGTELAIGGPDQLRAPDPDPEPLDIARVLHEAAVINDDLAHATGTGIRLELERNYARPGERWNEFFIVLDETLPLPELRIQQSLYALADGEQIARESFTPQDTLLLRAVDLRSLGADRARLRLELFDGDRRLGTAEAVLATRSAEPALAADTRIPVTLDLPAGIDPIQDGPVTFGVPFPVGGLWDIDTLKIVDADGNDIPFQAETTARWAPDGAIKWVRIDALADSERGLEVAAGDSSTAQLPATPLRVTETDSGVTVDTGTARYEVSAQGSLIQQISAGGHTLVSVGGRGLYVVDQNGRTATAAADGATLEIESDGPVAASLRIEGPYRLADGEDIARHITRLEFFAGRAEVEATHTLVITRDSNEIWFRQVGWEFAVSPGDQAQALMAVSRLDPDDYRDIPLNGGTARLLQTDYPGLSGEDKSFVLSYSDGSAERVLLEGADMGDWAALQGSLGAFMVICPDAARQHPKEFSLSADRFDLKLFSDAAGRELDFRAPALAERWGLEGREAERVAKFASNAIGWSRTHRLVFAPLAAQETPAQASRLTRIHSGEVYAHVDPHWIHHSRALGALYPRDTDRFPEAEHVIDGYIQHYMERVPNDHYTGYFDYYAGPHYGFSGRYRNTYTLLPDSWLVYARSGDRDVRRFAQGANRAFMDNYIAHWDGPEKTRGLFIGSSSPMADYPLYWEVQSADTLSTTSDFKRSLADYYLTGYRRGGDIVRQYADHVARAWHPDMRTARVILKTRLLAQAYTLTWDPELRALVEGTLTEGVYDPEGALLLSKDRPYQSTTYKTATDQDVFVELYEILGNRRSHDLATTVAEHWWNRNGISGRSTGIAAHFLYDETGDPTIAAGMDHFLRREAMRYDPATDRILPTAYSQLARVFQGLPHAMDIVVRSDADRNPPAAWIHVDDFRSPMRFFFLKDRDHTSELLYRDPNSPAGVRGGATGNAIQLIPHASARPEWAGQDLHQITYLSGGQIQIEVPKDAPGGVYEIAPTGDGGHFILADADTPLVFFAPGYWQPYSLRPEVPIFFELTPDSRDAAIFFEGSAVLQRPDGRDFADGEPVSGWVELPVDHPGIWSLTPVEAGLIRARNFPPFFTMGDKRFHFIPEGIEWEREKPVGAGDPLPAGDSEDLFVEGALTSPDSQALYLADGRKLYIDNDGGDLLPHREGTLEFFFRPDWSTFDLRDGLNTVSHRLVRVEADRPWILDYRIDPVGTRINAGPREPSHSLYASYHTELPEGGTAHNRLWRNRTLFEADRWVHVVWQWQEVSTEHGMLPRMEIYVDGQPSNSPYGNYPSSGADHAAAAPRGLIIGGGPGAAIDQLRISSSARYDGPFTPPARTHPLEADADTRALFRFDGTLEGEAPGRDAPVSGRVE